jgi:hypothetical protein
VNDLTPDRILARRAHLAWFLEERVPEWSPTYTLDRELEEARQQRPGFKALCDAEWAQYSDGRK